MQSAALTERIAALERRLRILVIAIAAALVLCPVLMWSASNVSAQDNRVLRVRGLVIEDAAGRDRIVLGAPIAEPQGRISQSTGLRINDPNGVERFAIGLLENNRVVMGFDAPPGKGDDRNRERITIVADGDGGGYIRFLNRKTGVPGRLVLGDDDRLYLEFNDVTEGKLTVKRIGFGGEQLVRPQ